MPNDSDDLLRRAVEWLPASELRALTAQLAQTERPPVLSYDAFLITMKRALTGLAGVERVGVGSRRELLIQLSVGGVVAIDLRQSYRVYTDENTIQRSVDRLIASVRGMRGHQDSASRTWEQTRPRVFPHLLLANDPAAQLQGGVRLPWVGGEIAYFEQTPSGGMAITQADLARWGVPVLDIHRAAQANLHDRAKQLDFSTSRLNGSTLLQAESKDESDPYLASLILVPGVLLTLLKARSALVGIPRRGLVVASTITDPDGQNAFTQVIALRHQQSASPFSAATFLITPTSVALFRAQEGQ